LRIIDEMKKNGAEGVIAGCTEITLLISQKDLDTPLFDTTTIHASEAVSYALNS
jgi:aspartate racemase